MIMLDRRHLGLMDITCTRNAFGRQVHSFEEDLEIPGVDGEPVRAVFIRAPWVEEHGDAVEVLAAVDGHPVAARQGGLMAISFHPELGDDDRLHRAFLEQVRAARNGG
jgi:5'-phosphate synthase pdxT subunit